MITRQNRLLAGRGLGTFLTAALVACLVLSGGSPVFAAPLTIFFSGADLSYASGTLSDAGSPSGNVGDPADGDELDTVNFSISGIPFGPVLTSDIAVDFSIPGVPSLSDTNPSTSVVTDGTPGYFDLLFGTSPSASEYLRLATSEVSIIYVNLTSSVHLVFGGAVVAISSQNLPLGLEIGDPVTVSFSSAVSSKSAVGDVVTSFLSSGTGEIHGTYVPEPAACILAVLGVGGLLAGRHRRR